MVVSKILSMSSPMHSVMTMTRTQPNRAVVTKAEPMAKGVRYAALWTSSDILEVAS